MEAPVNDISSLVERLRAPGGKFASICNEAAAALEQQAKEIDEEKAIASGWHKRWKEAQETIADLRAELADARKQRDQVEKTLQDSMGRNQETIAALRAENETLEIARQQGHADACEAEDKLEEAQAEIKRLVEENEAERHNYDRMFHEAARLRAALEKIADGCTDEILVARAALGGEGEK